MYSISTLVPLSQHGLELSLPTDPGTPLPTSPACLQYPDLSDKLCGHPILQIYEKVRQTGVPNFKCARVPLPSNFNIHNWKKHLQHSPSHSDLLLYLEYGFPINYTSNHPPVMECVNHSSALNFPTHVDNHIQLEIQHQAMVGPVVIKPFMQWSHSLAV